MIKQTIAALMLMTSGAYAYNGSGTFSSGHATAAHTQYPAWYAEATMYTSTDTSCVVTWVTPAASNADFTNTRQSTKPCTETQWSEVDGVALNWELDTSRSTVELTDFVATAPQTGAEMRYSTQVGLIGDDGMVYDLRGCVERNDGTVDVVLEDPVNYFPLHSAWTTCPNDSIAAARELIKGNQRIKLMQPREGLSPYANSRISEEDLIPGGYRNWLMNRFGSVDESVIGGWRKWKLDEIEAVVGRYAQ